MNLIETIDNFKFNNTFYLFPIKNTVILDSNFIRILYSNNLFTLNGIYIKIALSNIISNENKIKYFYDKEINKKTTEFIKNLEENLLINSIINDKEMCLKMKEQINSDNIKNINPLCYNSEKNTINLIIKISGIWESEIQYGLTYKLLPINNILSIC